MTQLEINIAAIQQLLLAATFVVITFAALKYGGKAQKAAEESVIKQGFDGQLLLKNGIKFAESKLETLLPFTFAAVYIVTALLLLSGHELGKTFTWVIEPFTLVIVGWVTANQVFAVNFLRRAFKKSPDAQLQKINVDGFVAAAVKEFPSWLRGMQIFRFVLATAGSLLIISLLIF